MKFILLISFFLISMITPAFSHGSKEDCSTECNDYYCPPENKKEKNKKLNIK